MSVFAVTSKACSLQLKSLQGSREECDWEAARDSSDMVCISKRKCEKRAWTLIIWIVISQLIAAIVQGKVCTCTLVDCSAWASACRATSAVSAAA